MVDPVLGASATMSASPSDEDLVAQALANDVAAFEDLLGRHEGRLYRLALRMMKDEDDAREVLQDAFVSAWKGLKTFEGKSQFGSWIYRVVANTALMALRSKRRHPSVSVDDVEPSALEAAVAGAGQGLNWARRPDDDLQGAELRQAVDLAIAALPDAQRVVLQLRDVDELSTGETAALLGINEPNVKTRLHRARLALRLAIGAYFARI